MPNVALVGDSVFDNASYVTGPDVSALVAMAVPTPWNVSLLAVDGSRASDVPTQLSRLPDDAAFMIVSAGGNDALEQADVLGTPVDTVGSALLVLAGILARFRADYSQLLDSVIATSIRSYVCTIYRPRFPDTALQRVTETALGLFNDVIVEEAGRRRLPLLDLRGVFTDERDYANPIEPSVEGGRKLAAAIAELVANTYPEAFMDTVIA